MRTPNKKEKNCTLTLKANQLRCACVPVFRTAEAYRDLGMQEVSETGLQVVTLALSTWACFGLWRISRLFLGNKAIEIAKGFCRVQGNMSRLAGRQRRAASPQVF